MLGKVLKKKSPSSPTNDALMANMLGDSLAEMLNGSGRVSLEALQKVRLMSDLEAFVAFVRLPVLIGSTILSGTPDTNAATDKNHTVVFDIMKSSEEDPSSSDSLKKAVYPLVRSALTLASKSTFSIGRVDSNDIVMPDFALSKHHASIEMDSGTYRLRDCDSTNGTTVNGQRLDPKKPQVLQDGDVVSFARYEFTFLFPESLYDKLRMV